MNLVLAQQNCAALRCVSQGNTVANTVAMSIPQNEAFGNRLILRVARVVEWQTRQT